jgi:hypothetical protein
MRVWRGHRIGPPSEDDSLEMLAKICRLPEDESLKPSEKGPPEDEGLEWSADGAPQRMRVRIGQRIGPQRGEKQVEQGTPGMRQV